jgi:hypothetical protein
MFKILCPILLVLLLTACAGVSRPGRFSDGTLEDWRPQSFGLSTQYRLVEQDGLQVLEARSEQSASALYQKLAVDLNKTPYLNWRWKIQHSLGEMDEQIKAGDDYPARVYVMVSSQPMLVYPRALCYVWSSNTPVGGAWPSPYTDDVIIVPLQSGDRDAGRWRDEKRNVKQDLVRYFGEEFQTVEGIAVMTDTDNSKSAAISYFGDLVFTAQ